MIADDLLFGGSEPASMRFKSKLLELVQETKQRMLHFKGSSFNRKLEAKVL